MPLAKCNALGVGFKRLQGQRLAKNFGLLDLISLLNAQQQSGLVVVLRAKVMRATAPKQRGTNPPPRVAQDVHTLNLARMDARADFGVGLARVVHFQVVRLKFQALYEAVSHAGMRQ